jgi:hypothetical protein
MAHSNLSVSLFANRPRHPSTLTEASVDAYTTRYFLACMEKLDLLTGPSDYTTKEWFDLICAAILMRTVVPGNSEYGKLIEPQSVLMDDGPTVALIVEGVTVTGSIPVSFVLHDIVTDHYRVESRIDPTVSDILAGFDEVKVATTLTNLKLKYDSFNVARLVDNLNEICEKLEEEYLAGEAAVMRFGRTLGCAQTDPEEYSRALLDEPEHYLKHTQYKVTPNTVLIPGGIIPSLTPYSTLKAFEIRTMMMSWDPLTAQTVSVDAPPVEVQRVVGKAGGINLDMIPYNVNKKQKRYTCVGEAVPVGTTMTKGMTSGKFDPQDFDVKVFSVSTDSWATYTMKQMVDNCWLLFDAAGDLSEYVTKSVNAGDTSIHPYYRGGFNGTVSSSALASAMEKTMAQSQSEAASISPFTRTVMKDDGDFRTSVAKYLGDLTLQSTPRSHFAKVAHQIVSSFDSDIRRSAAEFALYDREIFEASHSTVLSEQEREAWAGIMSKGGKISFAGLDDDGLKNAGLKPVIIPPGAGPFEYLQQLAENKDIYTAGGYGAKAAKALQLLSAVQAEVSRYLGDSHAFSEDRVPRFSATRSRTASFYYAMSNNNWKFLPNPDGGHIYFGIPASSRQESIEERAKVIRDPDTKTLSQSVLMAPAIQSAMAYTSVDCDSNSRKRKRDAVASKPRDKDEMDLSSMTTAKSGKKKVSAKRGKTKQSAASTADASSEIGAGLEGYIHVSDDMKMSDVPLDLYLRLSTIDEAGGGLASVIVWALCLVELKYSSINKLVSTGVGLPFAFCVVSKDVMEIKKTLFIKRTSAGQPDLVKGGGILLSIIDPIATKQALATEKFDIRLKHRCVMRIATDVTGIPSHITKYHSGRNRIFFDTPEKYIEAKMGKGEPDALVIPIFASEYPGSQNCDKPFILADSSEPDCPALTHAGQKRYATLFLKHVHVNKPIASAHCVFPTEDEAADHQPAYYLRGSYWQTDRELKKEIYHKGEIFPSQRANVPGAAPAYYGKTVLGVGLVSQVEII